MTAFRAALNQALEDGYVSSDAAWKTRLRPIANAGRRRDIYLDSAERLRLVNESGPDLAAFLRVLSMLPLRPGAVANLKVGDFDRRLSTITVGKDKAGKGRKITLPPAIAAFFEELSTNKLPSAPLLTRAGGSAWKKDTWKYPVKDAIRAAGLPEKATAYALRHSAITDLLSLHRLDTATVAALSGTSMAMIERHYAHLLRDHAAAALDRLVI
jgi:integrase